jgi:hypothetical protein
MPKINKTSWQAVYGARRRVIDRRILAEAERAIPDEPKDPRADARERIAAAFGRPK